MPRLSIIFLAAVCSKAQELAADFEGHCQSGSCDSSTDMYLIQKKVEVGVGQDGESSARLQVPEPAEKPLHKTVSVEDVAAQVVASEEKAERAEQVARVAEKMANKAELQAEKVQGSPDTETSKKSGDSDDSSKESDDSSKKSDDEPEPVYDKDKKEFFVPDDDSGNSSSAGGNSSNCTVGEWDFVTPWSCWNWNGSAPVASNMYHEWNEYIVMHVLTWFIWVLLAMLVWFCCFPGEPEIFRNPEDPVEAFKTKHFNCFKTPRICCCSLFCPCVQWSDTMHLSGFMKVWVALPIFFVAAFLNGFAMGDFAQGIFTALLIIHYRQHLRYKLGLNGYTCTSCAFDCLYVCFCPWCAIAQEAQVVRYAYIQSSYTPRSGVMYASKPPTGTLPRVVSVPTRQGPSPSGSRVITGPSPTSSGVIYTRSLTPSRSPVRSLSPRAGSGNYVMRG